MRMKPMDGINPSFTLSVEDRRWHCYIGDLNSFALRICKRIQQKAPVEKQMPLEINLLFSNARQVKKLNHDFRHKNKSTNVLSFPAPNDLGGDIILSFEDVFEESLKQQKKFQAHTAHLIVHGCLHLLGYTHYHPSRARQMENLETFILSFCKISNPWRKAKVRFFTGI